MLWRKEIEGGRGKGEDGTGWGSSDGRRRRIVEREVDWVWCLNYSVHALVPVVSVLCCVLVYLV